MDSRKFQLYKTEMCRNWQEIGDCRYGKKCRFAHGQEELRCVKRHARYKTEICRTFHSTGTCLYGVRCTFIHDEHACLASTTTISSPSSSPFFSATLKATSNPIFPLSLTDDNSWILSKLDSSTTTFPTNIWSSSFGRRYSSSSSSSSSTSSLLSIPFIY